MQQETAPGLYERDFALWAEEQAAALRAGRIGDLDLENVAEEIDALARRDRRQILRRLIQLEFHLLKWQYQPERASKSWRRSIREQARRIRLVLNDSPSLWRELDGAIVKAYVDAREMASDETEMPLATFPEKMTPELTQAVQLAIIGKHP